MSKSQIKPVTGTEIVVSEEKLLNYLDALGLSKELSKEQTKMFVELAIANQLNPFKREIYAVKFKDKFNIITGYEVYIKRAERSGKLDGWEAEVIGEPGKPGCKAKVTIYRKDWTRPFVHTVEYSEYVQNSPIWQSKPATMIKKVVIAQGFRLAFPDELGGMPYTADEIMEDPIPTYTPTEVEIIPEPIQKQEPNKTVIKKEEEFIPTLYSFIDKHTGDVESMFIEQICKEALDIPFRKEPGKNDGEFMAFIYVFDCILDRDFEKAKMYKPELSEVNMNHIMNNIKLAKENEPSINGFLVRNEFKQLFDMRYDKKYPATYKE
jgi:phage recombination protein Bet